MGSLEKINVLGESPVESLSDIPNVEGEQRKEHLIEEARRHRGIGIRGDRLMIYLSIYNQLACKPPIPEEEVKQIYEFCMKWSPDYPLVAADEDGIYRMIEKDGDLVRKFLTNFRAWISRIYFIKDGESEYPRFIISGKHADGYKLKDLDVGVEDFESMKWIYLWGANCWIDPYFQTKGYIKLYLQKMAPSVESDKVDTVYRHLGWTMHKGQYFFLNNNGGIGKGGSDQQIIVDTDVSGLQDFHLPNPSQDIDCQRETVQNALSFLAVGPSSITYPLLAAIGRAPLNEVHPIDFSIGLFGPTGTFKTSLAVIVQSFFGKFGAHNLVESFLSTVNSIEMRANLAKDVIFTIDDYLPGMHSDKQLDQLFRGQGNKVARGRLTASSSVMKSRPSRSCILVTGEDVPTGHSLRSRIFILSVATGMIDKDRLSILQKSADGGKFAECTSLYLQWLASRLDEIRSKIAQEIVEIRTHFHRDGMHGRTSNNMASLAVGLKYFLQFAHEVGAITKEKSQYYWQNGLKSIMAASHEQSQHLETEDPAARFREALTTAFSSGIAYLECQKYFSTWEKAKFSWGWKSDLNGGIKYGLYSVGRHDGNEIVLDPDIAFIAAQRVANLQGWNFSFSKQAIWRRLMDQGLILTDGTGVDRKPTVKRDIGGVRKRCLVINNIDKFFQAPEAPEAPGDNTLFNEINLQ